MDASNDSLIEESTTLTATENRSPSPAPADEAQHIMAQMEEIGAMAVEAAVEEPATDSPDEPATETTREETKASPVAAGSDIVELELALQFQDMKALGFEGAVMAAVESIGGELLFEMPMAAETDGERVAAVSLGSGEERLLALVILPGENEAFRIEPAETSSNPVAGIVAAYAGLMEHFAIAA